MSSRLHPPPEGSPQPLPGGAPDGFTLVELIAACAIAGVLAALLLGAGKSVLAKTKEMKCTANLKGVGTGVMQSFSDSQGTWPALYYGKPWYAVLNETYAIQTNLFFCPAAVSPAFNANRISYGYNITLGGGAVSTAPKYRVAATRNPSELIVLADGIDTGSQQYYIVNGTPEPRMGSRHENKANIFWGDGHVTLQSKSDLTNAKYWRPDHDEL